MGRGEAQLTTHPATPAGERGAGEGGKGEGRGLVQDGRGEGRGWGARGLESPAMSLPGRQRVAVATSQNAVLAPPVRSSEKAWAQERVFN